MRLELVGLLHFDPLGKAKLSDWLKQSIRDGMPKFVAVEWDKQHLDAVIRQRPSFLEKAKLEWPDSSIEFLTALAETIGYEGDTHLQICSGVETLWLDSGRELPYPEALIKFSDARLDIFRKLEKSGVEFSDNDLEGLSLAAWRMSIIATSGTDRDVILAEHIQGRFSPSDEGWGIVIVGDNHARALPNSMGAILSSNGFECRLSSLRMSIS